MCYKKLTIWAWGSDDKWIKNMPKDLLLHYEIEAKARIERLA